MSGPWPAHKASYVMRLLCDVLGYEKSRPSSGGTEVQLTAKGLPPIAWTYKKKQTIAPIALCRILLKDVGLSEADATALLSSQPGRRNASGTSAKQQVGGHYIARTSPDFLDSLERVPNRVPKRWRARDGTLFEYDQMHGNVEGYSKRGKHLGEFDVYTGEKTGPAERGRTISV